MLFIVSDERPPSVQANTDQKLKLRSQHKPWSICTTTPPQPVTAPRSIPPQPVRAPRTGFIDSPTYSF
ncbi:UNVERIFIED_CONTAM: hypothetical protein FKN15_055219 [Acipenser sinensis]